MQTAEDFLADPGHVVLVAGEHEGFLLAYVMPRIDGRTAVFLYEVGVAEQSQRRGLGRALVEEAKAIARDTGAFEMYVLTEPDNRPANALYAATGATAQDACVMWTWTFR